ncbi:MAG: DHH family phosphoesterase [Deltaproteobacteria bacterium]|nr:DHH family phosphoesterase [Deltaproteobacteria bacterium]
MTAADDYDGLVDIFREAMLPADSALIVTHDFPDPDCLASAAGLTHLLTFWGVRQCVTSYGGFVGRAENRAMVKLLGLSAAPILLVDFKSFDRIMVVDAIPGGTNLSLPPGAPVDAVMDHHQRIPPEDAPYFWDVRPEMGATSTLVTTYLKKAHCPIPSKLATALFYGIKTDTGDMGTEVSSQDKECYKFLFDLMDHKLLASIEHPQRDPEFFLTLYRALTSMQVMGRVGHVFLGEMNTPDYTAEMADLFHSLQSVEWTLCSGVYKDALFFSIRCKDDGTAGQVAAGIGEAAGGSGGGHSKIGAGKVPLKGRTPAEARDALKKSLKNLLDVSVPEEPLLPRGDLSKASRG